MVCPSMHFFCERSVAVNMRAQVTSDVRCVYWAQLLVYNCAALFVFAVCCCFMSAVAALTKINTNGQEALSEYIGPSSCRHNQKGG